MVYCPRAISLMCWLVYWGCSVAESRVVAGHIMCSAFAGFCPVDNLEELVDGCLCECVCE
jgi:hypothetical protein